MAETVADHVVNGNQSMGSDPAPVDTPKEAQSSNHIAGDAGEVAKDKSTSQETHIQATNNASAPSQTATNLEQGVSTADSTVQGPHLPNGNAAARTLEDAQSPVQDKQENGSSLSTVDSASVVSNGQSDTTAFPEPSPMSAEGAELEWRRASSQTQGSITRSDRSNSIKKPTSFKSVSVTKNFLANKSSTTAPASKTVPDKGMLYQTIFRVNYELTNAQDQLRVPHHPPASRLLNPDSSQSQCEMRGQHLWQTLAALRVQTPVRSGIEIDVCIGLANFCMHGEMLTSPSKLHLKRHRNNLQTKSLSSNTAFISLHDYSLMSRAKARSGQTWKTMRTTGRLILSSGWTEPRLAYSQRISNHRHLRQQHPLRSSQHQKTQKQSRTPTHRKFRPPVLVLERQSCGQELVPVSPSPNQA